MDSVVALRHLIDAFDAEELPRVKAVLPQLLEEIFKLMNKVRLCLFAFLQYVQQSRRWIVAIYAAACCRACLTCYCRCMGT